MPFSRIKNQLTSACRSRGADRKGATATELALVLPVLITIVLACVDFGRFGYMYIAVSNSARAGAGAGYLKKVSSRTLTNWRNEIRAVATSELSGQMHFDATRLTIPDPQVIVEGNGMRRVQVQVSYRFSMLVPWPFLPNEFQLSRTVEMRLLN
jgi:Flp pilus assembly protein TadG